MKKEEFKNSDEKTRKSLDYSVKDGVANAVTVGTGDNFISPYAVALNANNFQIGLLSALPNLIPTELLTTKLLGKFSRKKIVLFSVLTQIFMLAALASVGLLFSGSLAPNLLIILFVLYAAAAYLMAPAWSSWMKDLTENIEIGKYFGMRNKIIGIAGLVAIILAGFFLDAFKKAGFVLLGFAVLFLVAAIARAFSRAYLKKQYEPKLKIKKESYFSFWQFIKKAPTNNYGRFAIFTALISFTVMIASPFFTPYMLEGLKFNYITYTIINLVISSLATLLTMPFWGKFIDKYGCVRTLRTTVWVLPVIPLLWIISPNIYWLAFIQIISGIAWAGFNLAAGTFTYHAVTKERMNLCVAYSSAFNGAAVFLGAITGGLIASLHISFMNIFLFVFLISGIARSIVISVLFPLIKEVRPVKAAKPLLKTIFKPLREGILGGFLNLYPHNGKKKKD